MRLIEQMLLLILQKKSQVQLKKSVMELQMLQKMLGMKLKILQKMLGMKLKTSSGVYSN